MKTEPRTIEVTTLSPQQMRIVRAMLQKNVDYCLRAQVSGRFSYAADPEKARNALKRYLARCETAVATIDVELAEFTESMAKRKLDRLRNPREYLRERIEFHRARALTWRLRQQAARQFARYDEELSARIRAEESERYVKQFEKRLTAYDKLPA